MAWMAAAVAAVVVHGQYGVREYGLNASWSGGRASTFRCVYETYINSSGYLSGYANHDRFGGPPQQSALPAGATSVAELFVNQDPPAPHTYCLNNLRPAFANVLYIPDSPMSCIGLPYPCINCTLYENFTLAPAAGELRNCRVIAGALNRFFASQFGSDIFSCPPDNHSGWYGNLVLNASVCELVATNLTETVLRACDFASEWINTLRFGKYGWNQNACLPLTTCSQGNTYQSMLPDNTPAFMTDRTCVPCTRCGSDTQLVSPCNLTGDTVCGNAINHPLSAGAIAAIVLTCIAVAGIVVFLVYRQQILRQSNATLLDDTMAQEVELERISSQNAEQAATVNRLRQAWRIPEKHIKLLRQLAAGSFGAVWIGLWGAQQVAIKVLHRAAVNELDDEAQADFEKECETLQSIKHPNLLVFFGAGTTAEGKAFMVTEFMAGGSLRTALKDLTVEFPWATLLRVAQQIAAGMCHLHDLGIVHRDMKSDNVLLDEGYSNAKVADFGTSKFLQKGKELELEGVNWMADGLATASMTKGVGTPLWMAPEVFAGSRTYSWPVDVYAYGIIMWELITRRDPWDELDAKSFIKLFEQLDAALKQGQRPTIPADFAEKQPIYVATLQQCWHANPQSRPSFGAIIKSLGGISDSDSPELAKSWAVPKRAWNDVTGFSSNESARVGSVTLIEPLLPRGKSSGPPS